MPKVKCQLVSAEPACSCHNLLLDLCTPRCWFREILGSCLKPYWGLGGNSGIYYLGTIQGLYPLYPTRTNPSKFRQPPVSGGSWLSGQGFQAYRMETCGKGS